MSIPRRRLGRSGLEVSALGFGCMGMSDLYGEAAARDDASSIRVIHRALDLGVTLLDTADVYGPFTNEQLVGRAIRDRRERAIIATKFGLVRDPADKTMRAVCGTPEYVRSACDASLERLGVDHIDLYYMHRRDRSVPVEETIGAMADLVTQGKVRYLGLSEVGETTMRKAVAIHPISALQSEWSLWSRDWEADAIPVARELGIGIVPYSPLGRGFLAGAITDRSQLPADDFRLTTPRFQEAHFDANKRIVESVSDLARAKHCTPAQLALGVGVVARRGRRAHSRHDKNRSTQGKHRCARCAAGCKRVACARCDAAFRRAISRTDEGVCRQRLSSLPSLHRR